jgi:hypothetical protein
LSKLSLGTTCWEWKQLASFELDEGEHTLYISYRKKGGLLDKICVSSYLYYEPKGMEAPAENACDPKVKVVLFHGQSGYALEQNYPNPFSTKTTLAFQLPEKAFVSLKVFNAAGQELAELAGKEYPTGRNIVEFDAGGYSKGIYFYTLTSNGFSATRKMVVGNR